MSVAAIGKIDWFLVDSNLSSSPILLIHDLELNSLFYLAAQNR